MTHKDVLSCWACVGIVHGIEQLPRRRGEHDFWVKANVIKEVVFLKHESETGLHHVLGVSEAVYPADFIPIMRRDIYLSQLRAVSNKLEKNLGVEVKVIGVQSEPCVCQRLGGVG